MKNQRKSHEEKNSHCSRFLATGMHYKDTAEKHQVSYNNIYTWVQKYKKHGPDGLVGGRGRGKPNRVQNEQEKLRTENAALKARNEYLKTENAALKKLKAVERKLMLKEVNSKQNIRPLRKSKKKSTK